MRLLTFLAFLLLITALPVSPAAAMIEQGAVAAGVSAARPWLLLAPALASVRSGRLGKIAVGQCLTVMTTLSTIDPGSARLGGTILLSLLLLASPYWFDHVRPLDNARGVRHVH